MTEQEKIEMFQKQLDEAEKTCDGPSKPQSILNSYWPIAIENIGITLGFIWLAIHFNNPWWCLLAFLGMTTIKRTLR